MGIVSFASLKGGVGKTTLALNVAAAFAERGCKTLIIDLDPTSHSSRLFLKSEFEGSERVSSEVRSPLARLLLEKRPSQLGEYARQVEERPEDFDPSQFEGSHLSLVDVAVNEKIALLRKVRENLWLLPAGPELRHFYWGRAARLFRVFFPMLIRELHSTYDYIIIDTPPDFNILTRNAIAVADLVQVPLDASVMSIHCLEELVEQASHIEGPHWSIVRTMVNRQASRIRKMSEDRLTQHLNLSQNLDDEEEFEFEPDDDDDFMSLIEKESSQNKGNNSSSPIYLLNSIVYRTEQQNKLTFLGSTAFERKVNRKLAEGYLDIAKEIESILCHLEESDLDDSMSAPEFGQSSALC